MQRDGHCFHARVAKSVEDGDGEVQAGGGGGNRAVCFRVNSLITLPVAGLIRVGAFFALDIRGQGRASEAFQVAFAASVRLERREPF